MVPTDFIEQEDLIIYGALPDAHALRGAAGCPHRRSRRGIRRLRRRRLLRHGSPSRRLGCRTTSTTRPSQLDSPTMTSSHRPFSSVPNVPLTATGFFSGSRVREPSPGHDPGARPAHGRRSHSVSLVVKVSRTRDRLSPIVPGIHTTRPKAESACRF